jgi:outer membrane receptor for ferrienterochelin and colicins
MTRRLWAVRSIVAFLAIAGSARGQAGSSASARLTGTVLDTAQMPMAGVVVELLGVAQTRSDSAGLFRFTGVPAGAVILHVARIGYRPIVKTLHLAPGDSIDLDVTLGRSAQQLAPIVVREDSTPTRLADPTGFERRRRTAIGGHFMTEAEITKSGLWETSALLRNFPGLSVDFQGVVHVERGANTIAGFPCGGVAVFVDGVAIPSEARASNKTTGFSVDEIATSSIRGIEFYSGPASTPAELRSSRTVCGTVAIWTK